MTDARRDVTGFRLSVVLVVVSFVLTGCQQAIDVGARNECGEVVEAGVVSKAELADENPAWSSLDPGERESVRARSVRAAVLQ